MTPMICTFQSENAPESERWMACFYVTAKDKKGVSKLERLPIHFSGKTEEGVIAAADKFWSDEQEKEAARIQSLADRAAKRKAA
jgi:hypothetical protein